MRNTGVNPETNLHTKLLAFIKLANIHLNHFPKHEKYGLCKDIRVCMYEVFNLVTECNKRYHKKTSLTTLDIRHEQLRMLFKLAHELGYYNYKNSQNQYSEKEANRRYLAINTMVDEIGAMIGGWLIKEKLKEKLGEGN
jgi:transcription antitermination factor NusA-like protein